MWKDPEFWKDDDKRWRWCVREDPIGTKMAESFKSYPNKAACQDNLNEFALYSVSAVLGIRSPVLKFAMLMEGQLREHDEDRGKRGWMDSGTNVSVLLAKLVEEVGELGKIFQRAPFPSSLPKEAADVGNLAMMLADRGLGL